MLNLTSQALLNYEYQQTLNDISNKTNPPYFYNIYFFLMSTKLHRNATHKGNERT